MAANQLSVKSSGAISKLNQVISDLKNAYFVKTPILKASFASGIDCDFELPVIEDTINLNFGEVEKTDVKLTNGTTWSSKTKLGDDDISFSLSTANNEVSKLFLEGGDALSAAFDGANGHGYSTAIKAVTGALIFKDSIGNMIVLTNVAMYGSFKGPEGDNPAYFSVKVTSKPNSEGTQFYLLMK